MDTFNLRLDSSSAVSTQPEVQPPEATASSRPQSDAAGARQDRGATQPGNIPSITLPKGGGAIRSIGEKFTANPVTGTASFSIPIATTPGRSGSGVSLSLSFDSGNGNGPFGLGWRLSVPFVSRKTDKGLPRYQDKKPGDTFTLTGAGDLVPALAHHAAGWERVTVDRGDYSVQQFRPRFEGSFTRIEKWTSKAESTEVFWRTISRDNVTSTFGRTDASRVFYVDEEEASPSVKKVFTWLISDSFDTKGNAVVYNYMNESPAGVDTSAPHEANRIDAGRRSNKYLKSIKYGNRAPNRDQNWLSFDPSTLNPTVQRPDAEENMWMFEIVLDYGDHDESNPRPMPDKSPTVRQDAFSTYRSGFEVRTYRLCRRVLMFHHFRKELGVNDYLVGDTSFTYDESPTASFLVAAKQSMHEIRNGVMVTRSHPSTEFEYTKVPDFEELSEMEIAEIDPRSTENLPYGIDGKMYQWLDLHGEGLQGVLCESGDAWFYKRNQSANNLLKKAPDDDGRLYASLAPINAVAQHPPGLSIVECQFIDLAGDGTLDIVRLTAKNGGFYSGDQVAGWLSYKPFQLMPNIDIHDRNTRLVDVTGDGRADMLKAEEDRMTVYHSLGDAGFDLGQSNLVPWLADGDDSKIGTPRVFFSDQTHTLLFADISGDGLPDILRIRNGEVSYLPSLGYGKFGNLIIMDNSPSFDSDEEFDPRRIRVGDIDGSGTTDILYLGRNGVDIYLNQSGNRLSSAYTIDNLTFDSISTVNVVDLLGNGASCLVWSTAVASKTVIKYLDLMGGAMKPHMLRLSRNNIGAETRLHYRPSTAFYLDDLQAGRPWATRLPFVIQCLSSVEVEDKLSGTTMLSRYAYHHGCFNGVEREFSGFACVEQWDAEDYAPKSSSSSPQPAADDWSPLPPAHTKTWYHTGVAAHNGSNLIETLALEFYGAPIDNSGTSMAAFLSTLIPQSTYSADIRLDNLTDATTALKGAIIRQEVYADDLMAKAGIPFTITEKAYSIESIQPRGLSDEHASFMVQSRETRTQHLERNTEDPRISQNMILDVDPYGNVRKSISVAFGRKGGNSELEPVDRVKQEQRMIEYEEHDFTHSILDEPDDYLIAVPCEHRAYEVAGLAPASGSFFSLKELVEDNFARLNELTKINFEDDLNASVGQMRLFQRSRTLYRANDLASLLPFEKVESLNIVGEAYALVLTPGLIDLVFKRPNQDPTLPAENLLPAPADVLRGQGEDQGGYVEVDGGGRWWKPTGRMFFSSDVGGSPADELLEGRRSFFAARCARTPFGAVTKVEYDADTHLVVRTTDALLNVATASNDYRVCSPYRVEDSNGNHSEVAFDILGAVAATAVYGKTTAEGDNLVGIDKDPDKALLDAFYANPTGPAAATLLGNATSRLVYDRFRYAGHVTDSTAKWPTYTSTILRETHTATLNTDPNAGPSKLQVLFSYQDGQGRELQRKIQAARESPGEPRWVGSGWSIFNNKGLVVRQYEPFFSETHEYQDAKKEGVSATYLYDAMARHVATIHPDHSWEKVVFDSWKHETWDANDTVDMDPAADEDVGAMVRELPPSLYQPSWSEARKNNRMGPEETNNLNKTLAHAATPTVTHLDSLGRTILTVADIGSGTKLSTRGELNIDGSKKFVQDASGRIAIKYAYDLLGTPLRQASMEAGTGWTIADITGNPIRSWDSRGFRTRLCYDIVRRPIKTFIQKPGDTTETLEATTVFGDSAGVDQDFARSRNLRGQTYISCDQAGKSTNLAFDFKGNLTTIQRELATVYDRMLDWSTTVELEQGTPYVGTSEYDALNRTTLSVSPDKSEVRHSYNEAGLLSTITTRVKGDQGALKMLVKSIQYNEKAQRTSVEHENGLILSFEYDNLTLRVKRTSTIRPNGRGGTELLRDQTYIYDAVGNITHIKDDAEQTIYFRNQRVEPSKDYTYDAAYRLIQAKGREHLGQPTAPGRPNRPTAPDQFNDFHTRKVHPGDGNAMGNYIETYEYDAVGNFKSMKHDSSDRTVGGWTRTYQYDAADQLGGPLPNNRLTGTAISGVSEEYRYDETGNTIYMSKVQMIQWNHRNQLRASAKQITNSGTPETTWYVYDGSGRRIRKVTEAYTPAGASKRRLHERIYIGANFEVYRKFNGDGRTVTLERETLHVRDGDGRVCMVESRTVGSPADGPERLFRYQIGDHTGSVALEVDDEAKVISYEEYTPYGSSSYQGVRDLQLETPKRYRFSGMERDEDTGLSYHGVRYYNPTLGTWTAADPASISGGINLYCYAGNNPISRVDTNGRQWVDISEDPNWSGPVRESLEQNPALINAPAAPNVPSNPNPVSTTKAARAQGARSGQQAFRDQNNLPPGVQAGHTMQVHRSKDTNLAPSVRDDPNTMQALHSRRGQGFSVDITDAEGRTRTYTVHNGQERLVDQYFERTEGSIGGRSAQVSASEDVRWATQNTPMDFRDAQEILSSPRSTEEERIQAFKDKKAAAAKNSTPAPKVAPSAPTPEAPHAPPAKPPAAHPPPSLPSAPEPHAPSPPKAPKSSGGGGGGGGGNHGGGSGMPRGGGSRLATTTAGVAGALAPEGFAEAEVALTYMSEMAGAGGQRLLSAGLARASSVVPVVGGSMAVGGMAGDATEWAAKKLGASEDTSVKAGMVASVLAGAGVGAAIGAPAGGVGALPGAIIGGAVGLASYLWGR